MLDHRQSSASAQYAANGASLNAACAGYSVELSVTLNILTELPENWAGWVIDRSSIGLCGPTARVVGPEVFPSGYAAYQFVDNTAVPGQAYRYTMRPVNDQGAVLSWYHPDYDQFFPPVYIMIDRTTCFDAPAVRGRLIDMSWTVGIEVCEGQCWDPLAFISELPAALLPLVGTDAVVELRGTLADDFEGPYLTNITGWTLLPGCGSVSTAPDSWSGVKGRFR